MSLAISVMEKQLLYAADVSAIRMLHSPFRALGGVTGVAMGDHLVRRHHIVHIRT